MTNVLPQQGSQIFARRDGERPGSQVFQNLLRVVGAAEKGAVQPSAHAAVDLGRARDHQHAKGRTNGNSGLRRRRNNGRTPARTIALGPRKWQESGRRTLAPPQSSVRCASAGPECPLPDALPPRRRTTTGREGARKHTPHLARRGNQVQEILRRPNRINRRDPHCGAPKDHLKLTAICGGGAT